jgi:hypothetical protein
MQAAPHAHRGPPAVVGALDPGLAAQPTQGRTDEESTCTTPDGDPVAKNFTTTSTSNKLAGVNVTTAANPSATGRVRLNGSFTQ